MMSNRKTNEATNFGGIWTIQKLDILENYLDAYTTALKKQPFKIMYIDVFAGTGKIRGPKDKNKEASEFVSGSAERALKIENKPFDKLIFVEKDAERCSKLEDLRSSYRNRDVEIENDEANSFLANLNPDWNRWRGVLFLDPFATEVEWSTIERISSFKALDTWILVPVSAIARMLQRHPKPDEIPNSWATRLTKIYGDKSWEDLYKENPPDLFGYISTERAWS